MEKIFKNILPWITIFYLKKRMKEKRFCRKEKINYQEMKSMDFLMSFMDLKSCLCLF